MTRAVGRIGLWRLPIGRQLVAFLAFAALDGFGIACSGVASRARAQDAPSSQFSPAPQSAPNAKTAPKPVIPPGGDEMTPRLELMLRTMRIARDWHVNRPGKPELVAGAIQGLLQRIDGEAEIYSRAELKQFTDTAAPAIDLIGLEIRRDPALRRQVGRGYRVVSSRDGSPAARAGLKAGDLITHIDGKPAGDMSYLAVTRWELVGATNTVLSLTLEREGQSDPVEVQLTRAAAETVAVSIASVANGIAVIRIAAIEPTAAAAIERQLAALRDGPSGSLRGVVVDLRGTASGGVAEAAAVADAFLDQGVVFATEARNARDVVSTSATPGDATSGRPLVVLIDAGTAGPAEVLAAALQDNKRARLVGAKSAGRAGVRTLRGLGRNGEKGSLRMITSRQLTPLGKPIEGRGLTPDVALEQTPADTACRPIDISDPAAPGRCIRRKLDQDAQLGRALSILEQQSAAGTFAATPRP